MREIEVGDTVRCISPKTFLKANDYYLINEIIDSDEAKYCKVRELATNKDISAEFYLDRFELVIPKKEDISDRCSLALELSFNKFMDHSFKIGDIVTCIEGSSSSPSLKIGNNYRITNILEKKDWRKIPLLALFDEERNLLIGSWKCTRFKLASSSSKLSNKDLRLIEI